MEVKLDKKYPVAASVDQAWAVLTDVRATAACMPGAQITEQVDDTHYKGAVKSKVGPATMSFAGTIEVLAMEPATRTLRMLGAGADKAGSSASMDLTARVVPADDGGSVLEGEAIIKVNGKLAQFGSRLLVPVADAMLAQFADRFRATAASMPVAGAGEAVATEGVVQRAGTASDTQATGTAADASAQGPDAVATGASAQTSAGSAATVASAAASTTTGAAPHDAPSATAAAAPAAAAASRPAPAAPAAAPRPLPPAPAPTELNALALAWIVIKGWFAGLFGRKS